MTAVTPQAIPAPTSLDDVFLIVFCLIDDLYAEVAPPALRERSQHERIETSDSEVLTLSVMQEALSMDSEASFLRFVAREHGPLFPRLLSRDRYSRRRRALTGVALALFRRLADAFEDRARWLVVDSPRSRRPPSCGASRRGCRCRRRPTATSRRRSGTTSGSGCTWS